MATLLQVAKRLGELTSLKAPKRTGNLRKRLREVNTGRNVLGGRNSAEGRRGIIDDIINNTSNFVFNIDVSPSGAEYGEWWNTPPDVKSKRRKKLSKRKEFNFYDQAYESTEFQQLLNDYIDTLVIKIENEIADEIQKAIN